MSLQELEQDPFDPDEFMERLAWKTMGGSAARAKEDFDPMVLHSSFVNTIQELKDMKKSIQKQVERMEGQCKDEEKVHWQRVIELQKHNQVAFSHFQGLDERINFVATKVVHLGDQLEGVSTPRARDAEAQTLVRYFNEFMQEFGPTSQVFNDPFQLHLAADIIQKLYLIAHELPYGDKFDKARDRITAKYEAIEQSLLEEFRRAHHEGDKRSMRRTASMLSHFKGYNRCIDIFIEESQKGGFTRPNIYQDIPPLCSRTHELITAVFTNPEVVMSKFVLNVYNGKLQTHIGSVLKEKSDLEKYLKNLHSLYMKTLSLSGQLAEYNMGGDSNFMNKAIKLIFYHHTSGYIELETRFLREKCSAILQRYYDARGHQKKNIQSGGIHEFRRDLQAVIGTKANLNLGPTIQNYGGETFLSQEVAVNLLQESKLALQRCQVLSDRAELADNSSKIFDILIQHLCVEHIDYALELGLQAIPLADPKSVPEIYFYDVVGQANTMFHLFEKQFTDHLVPLVSSSPKHSECMQRKREVMESMENKLDMGLDRLASAMVGWVRQILITVQKKTDFKPETDDMQMYSPACGKVVKYINSQLTKLNDCLDGKNVEAVLTEFGIRFHRVVFEHLQQYQYNSMGGMLVICDINEYRKCVKDFHLPLITQLFDTLHALCNLLVVVPENLKLVCSGEQLSQLEKVSVQNFIQLRSDYKTARLASFIK